MLPKALPSIESNWINNLMSGKTQARHPNGFYCKTQSKPQSLFGNWTTEIRVPNLLVVLMGFPNCTFKLASVTQGCGWKLVQEQRQEWKLPRNRREQSISELLLPGVFLLVVFLPVLLLHPVIYFPVSSHQGTVRRCGEWGSHLETWLSSPCGTCGRCCCSLCRCDAGTTWPAVLRYETEKK